MSRFYKYDNGLRIVKTYVREGWHQFHSMCAQTRTYTNDRYVVHDFVSYTTPICSAKYDLKYDVWYIMVNAECFNCSNSTIRQFSRWLRESTLPKCVSYYAIKELSKTDMSGTPDICTGSLNDNVHVSFCTDSYFMNHFEW